MISFAIIACLVLATWLTIYAVGLATYPRDAPTDRQARILAVKVIGLLTLAAVLVSVPFILVIAAVMK